MTVSEMPTHNHLVNAGNSAANSALPTSNFFAKNAGAYASGSNAAMAAETVTNAGGSQPHPNMGPYLVISFAIALQGLFPSQN